MSNNNEHKIEKKQTSSKLDYKKKKTVMFDGFKTKEQRNENVQKDPIKNFEKLLITEKDNFNKSQDNFLEPQKIKIGER